MGVKVSECVDEEVSECVGEDVSECASVNGARMCVKKDVSEYGAKMRVNVQERM